MTTVTLELPEQVVSRVERRAATRGVTLSQQVSELLDKSLNENDDERRVDTTRQPRVAQEIAEFAAAHAGSELDLDRGLEAAAVEALSEDQR